MLNHSGKPLLFKYKRVITCLLDAYELNSIAIEISERATITKSELSAPVEAMSINKALPSRLNPGFAW
jgi:hypothetical protein